MHDPEKSDSGIVAMKPTNKAGRPVAEPVEPRPGTKGNADQQSTHRAQSRARVTQALGRVRLAARQRKKEQFTALLHHINVDTLRTAFYALKRNAAPGVDGMRWRLIKQVRGPPLEPQRLVNPDARAPIGIEDDRAGVVLGQSALDLPQDLLAARNITLDGLRRYQHVDLLVASNGPN